MSTGQGKEASGLLQNCMAELRQLKAENKELKLKLQVATDYTEALKAENERLREEVEGLHAMIQQAIHPQSE